MQNRTYNGQTVARGYFMGVIPGVFVGSVEGIKEAVGLEPTGEVWQGWPGTVRKSTTANLAMHVLHTLIALYLILMLH